MSYSRIFHLILLAILAWPATADAAMPRPPVEHLTYGPCPTDVGFATDGCAYPDGRIYVTERGDKIALRHERGHLVDAQILNDGDRVYFTRMFGYPAGTPWRTTVDHWDTPNEKFADAYMTCSIGMLPNSEGRTANGGVSWHATSGYDPTMRQHRRICAALERVARRAR